MTNTYRICKKKVAQGQNSAALKSIDLTIGKRSQNMPYQSRAVQEWDSETEIINITLHLHG